MLFCSGPPRLPPPEPGRTTTGRWPGTFRPRSHPVLALSPRSVRLSPYLVRSESCRLRRASCPSPCLNLFLLDAEGLGMTVEIPNRYEFLPVVLSAHP